MLATTRRSSTCPRMTATVRRVASCIVLNAVSGTHGANIVQAGTGPSPLTAIPRTHTMVALLRCSIPRRIRARATWCRPIPSCRDRRAPCLPQIRTTYVSKIRNYPRSCRLRCPVPEDSLPGSRLVRCYNSRRTRSFPPWPGSGLDTVSEGIVRHRCQRLRWGSVRRRRPQHRIMISLRGQKRHHPHRTIPIHLALTEWSGKSHGWPRHSLLAHRARLQRPRHRSGQVRKSENHR